MKKIVSFISYLFKKILGMLTLQIIIFVIFTYVIFSISFFLFNWNNLQVEDRVSSSVSAISALLIFSTLMFSAQRGSLDKKLGDERSFQARLFERFTKAIESLDYGSDPKERSKSQDKFINLISNIQSNITSRYGNDEIHKRLEVRREVINFRGMRLGGYNLSYAPLEGADLSGASFAGANLSHANLSHAILRKTNLVNSDLRDSELVDADFEGANLSGANLMGANFLGASLKDARFFQVRHGSNEAEYPSKMYILISAILPHNLLEASNLEGTLIHIQSIKDMCLDMDKGFPLGENSRKEMLARVERELESRGAILSRSTEGKAEE